MTKDYLFHETNNDEKKKRKNKRNKVLWSIALLIVSCGVFWVADIASADSTPNKSVFFIGAFLSFVLLITILIIAIAKGSFSSKKAPEDFRVFSELVPLFREHLLPFGYQEKFGGDIFKILTYTKGGTSVELSVDMRDRYYIFSISDSGIYQIMPDKRAEENIYNVIACVQDKESEKKFVAKVKENFDIWQGIDPRE